VTKTLLQAKKRIHMVATSVEISKIVDATGVFISKSVEGCTSKGCRPGLRGQATHQLLLFLRVWRSETTCVIISKSVEKLGNRCHYFQECRGVRQQVLLFLRVQRSEAIGVIISRSVEE
jgi:hypothetical protein